MAKYDLARFRREHNLTQKQLAEILKVTQGFMSAVENGRAPFPDERRKDFEAAFPGVDLDDYRSLESLKEEFDDMPAGNRRTMMQQIMASISRLFTEEDFDDIIEDTAANDAGQGFGGQRSAPAPTLADAKWNEDGSVPHNLQEAIKDLLNQNDRLTIERNELKLEVDALREEIAALRQTKQESAERILTLREEILDLKQQLLDHEKKALQAAVR